MKYIPVVVILLVVIGLAVPWLFFPSSISWFKSIWMALDRPAFYGRVWYFVGFWAGVVFLAVRIGKSGPI